jgi:hypothetical protein
MLTKCYAGHSNSADSLEKTEVSENGYTENNDQ